MEKEIVDTINKDIETPIYYVNNVEASGGIFDVTLKCFHRQEEKTIEQCSLVMSPQHAKSLLEVLQHFVGMYEQEVMPLSRQDGGDE